MKDCTIRGIVKKCLDTSRLSPATIAAQAAVPLMFKPAVSSQQCQWPRHIAADASIPKPLPVPDNIYPCAIKVYLCASRRTYWQQFRRRQQERFVFHQAWQRWQLRFDGA